MSSTEEPVIVFDNLSNALQQADDDAADAVASSEASSLGSNENNPEVQDNTHSSSSGRNNNRRWNGRSSTSRHRNRRAVLMDNESVDTTILASSVGSVVGPTRNAFVRCVVFYDDVDNEVTRTFDITFSQDQESNKKSFLLRRSSNKPVTVSSMSPQLEAVCKLEVGDVVTKLNKKSIGPSYNSERVSQLWQKSVPVKDSKQVRSIQTGNDAGLDTVLQVTLIKPNPETTAAELGLGVWWWRGLCVRFVEPQSLASFTPLKVDDELESINDILLEDVRNPDDFDTIVKALPVEVTLVIKRGKHRFSGQFK